MTNYRIGQYSWRYFIGGLNFGGLDIWNLDNKKTTPSNRMPSPDFYIINPLTLMKNRDKFSNKQIADIMEKLYNVDLSQYIGTPAEFYETEEEVETAVVKWESAIDKHTEYIENYEQKRSADESNRKIRNIIKFVKETHELPSRISEKDFNGFMFSNAKEIVDFTKENGDKETALVAIKWLKRIGFKKIENPINNDVIFYRNIFSTDFERYFQMSYVIKSNSDNSYSFEYYYLNSLFKSLKEEIKPVHLNPKAEVYK